MSAAMEVLKRKDSRSSVSFLIRRFVRRSSSVGSASPPEESPPVTSERARLSQRETPSMPLPSQGPPSFHGPMNIRKPRSASEPKRSTYSCGLTTLPRLLLIFCPSGPSMVPWLRRRVIGSPKTTKPWFLLHLGKKAGVEQVQYGVLDATGVQVHRKPLLSAHGIKGSLVVVRREVTVPVP